MKNSLFPKHFEHWPKITVVTPSLQQGRFLEQTIESVLSQNYPFLEYIIIDGGSSGETLDIIKKYQKFLYYWISEPDRGHSDAVNKGFSQGSGELFAFLNADDIYYPNCLQEVAKYFVNSPTAILYGDGLWIDRKGKKLLRYPSHKPNFYSLEQACCLCQPTVFIPRRVFDKVGKFTVGELSLDYEYWFRCLHKNISFVKIPRILSGSRIHSDTLSSQNSNYILPQMRTLQKTYVPRAHMSLWKRCYYILRIRISTRLREFIMQRKNWWRYGS